MKMLFLFLLISPVLSLGQEPSKVLFKKTYHDHGYIEARLLLFPDASFQIIQANNSTYYDDFIYRQLNGNYKVEKSQKQYVLYLKSDYRIHHQDTVHKILNDTVFHQHLRYKGFDIWFQLDNITIDDQTIFSSRQIIDNCNKINAGGGEEIWNYAYTSKVDQQAISFPVEQLKQEPIFKDYLLDQAINASVISSLGKADEWIYSIDKGYKDGLRYLMKLHNPDKHNCFATVIGLKQHQAIIRLGPNIRCNQAKQYSTKKQ